MAIPNLAGVKEKEVPKETIKSELSLPSSLDFLANFGGSGQGFLMEIWQQHVGLLGASSGLTERKCCHPGLCVSARPFQTENLRFLQLFNLFNCFSELDSSFKTLIHETRRERHRFLEDLL